MNIPGTLSLGLSRPSNVGGPHFLFRKHLWNQQILDPDLNIEVSHRDTLLFHYGHAVDVLWELATATSTPTQKPPPTLSRSHPSLLANLLRNEPLR